MQHRRWRAYAGLRAAGRAGSRRAWYCVPAGPAHARHEEAAPEYRTAIGLDPKSARAHLGLADALSNTGRHEEAAPEYRTAIGLDPKSARAHLGLARALSVSGMTTEAQRAYERAIDLDPTIDQVHYRTFGR